MDVDNFLRLGDIIFYHEELFLFFLKRRERATISFSNLFSFVTSHCLVRLVPPSLLLKFRIFFLHHQQISSNLARLNHWAPRISLHLDGRS